MRIGRKSSNKASNPSKNNSTKNLAIILVIAVAVMLIIWVYMLGQKAQRTVKVIMYNQDIFKNQVITADMLTEYDMAEVEFEKYAVENKDGSKTRRIWLFEEAPTLVNTFAAYPLHKDTVAFKRDVITSRVDNSDSVLYSFPGKDIIELNVDKKALTAFKTFLQPGDRVNVTALFKEKTRLDDADTGNSEEIETLREEPFLKDVMIADLLNQDGQSILDIYASYNMRTTYEQAQLDASEAFQKSVEPNTLLIALTPEEIRRYYEYMNISDVVFNMSLPQRSK